MFVLSFLLCLLVLAMGAAGFVLYHRFFTTLKNEFPDTWEALGKPSMVFYDSLEGQRATHRFVVNREYEALGDSKFTKLSDIYRNYLRVYNHAIVAACAALVFTAIGMGG